jgi:hypothetical protein
MQVTRQRILRDEGLDQALLLQGFIVFPVLNKRACEDLKSFYLQHHTQEQPGMSASAHAPDIAYRKAMSAAILEVVAPAIKPLLSHAELLGASFISKSAGQFGALPPHQDWNITDEQQFRSFNLWLPLVDTGKDNGGIQVLAKSHLAGLNYRGPGIPSISENIMDRLWPAMTTLDIPAGHALLYDHRLLHSSGPNDTNAPRIVAVMGVMEQGAPMRIYYANQGAIAEYNCSPSFFLEQNPNEGPDGLMKIREIAYSLEAPSKFMALNSLKQAGVLLPNSETKVTTFWSQAQEWFSKIISRNE